MMKMSFFNVKATWVSFPFSVAKFSTSVPADWDKYASVVNKCQEGLGIEAERRSGGHVHLKSELSQEFSSLNRRFSFINYTNNTSIFINHDYMSQIRSWCFLFNELINILQV